jgi:asparagine synthase (glutamine-hydrolysing)
MCGIAGVFYAGDGFFDSDEALVEAVSLIRYRGPDDQGVSVNQNAAFAHVRLSILDLSESGRQPMMDADGSFVIAYNGETYNYQDLKARFGLSGEKFQSSSDTEVVLKLFGKIGTKCFAELNGMFAFALMDKRTKKAYLVRDRFGIKPLYYFKDMGRIYFASEIKSISMLANMEMVPDLESLSEWSYYGNSIRRNTYYKNCKKLLPGSYIEIDLESLDSKELQYWRPEEIKQLTRRDITYDQAVKKTRELLESAVVRQLVSDVPVGVFLSGGIDSSAITAFASRAYAGKMKSFSVGFDYDKGVNELPKARLIAKKFGTDHHELYVDHYELAETIEKLICHHDGPFSDAANIPLYLLGHKVKSDIKVILQGDGGDEIFAGYRRYVTLGNRKFWRPLTGVLGLLNYFTPRTSDYYSRKRYINALASKNDADLMALLLTVESQDYDPRNVFSEDIRCELMKMDPFRAYRDCDYRFQKLDIVQKMLYTDTQIILPDTFLEKVDRATMAASIEVRVPFLDNDLTEFVMSLPSAYKLKRGIKKRLLKDALKGVVPESILHGPKTGFSVPYNYWLKRGLKCYFLDKLKELENSPSQILDVDCIRKLIEENDKGSRDHGFLLWKVLNLTVWMTSSKGLNWHW